VDGAVNLTRWHSLVSDEVFDKLETSSDGLSINEAEERLKRYGRNEIAAEKKETKLKVFLRQFANVLILILIIAAVVSFAIGEVVDAGTILLIVLLNALLGFTQEWKAEKAMEALKRLLGQRARVVRGGETVEIDAALIVPGDVVVLDIGEKLPADTYIFESNSLAMDEAPLTGESTPVEKNVGVVPETAVLVERSNIAFMGTTVANGWGRGVVVATGMTTEFGKIAGLAQEVVEEETPLANRLNVLGRRIGEISLVIAGLVILAGILQQRDLVEMFFIGISLAVAVIPEGLPAVVTLTLALGIKNMARRNCLIRRLPASETLGSASVICTDKTGTLTKNEMTVKKIYTPGGTFEVTGSGYEPKGEFRTGGETVRPGDHPDLIQFLQAGLLCSHATVAHAEDRWSIIGAPTEGALVVAAHKAALYKKDIASPESPLVSEFSFSSVRKRMTVIYHDDGDTAYVKGAPEVILERCAQYLVDGTVSDLTAAKKEEFRKIYEDFAGRGLRVLATAYRDLPQHLEITPDAVEQELVFLGFAGILDPPRPEVKDAMSLCRSAGIDVIMMTGDSPLTAWAVAEEIGLGSRGTLQGTDIDRMSDVGLKDALLKTKILARVSPAHKLRVIEILREGEHTIAMTGDGVNDAPALKRANIGIAMGIKGTDVAKEASDMVLVDDNFASIVSGVEEGRREYDNILKFTRYLLSSNFGEIIAITGAILLNLPLILLPVQILWMNLVTDGLTALALGLEPAEKDAMQQRPRDPKQPILSRGAFAAISLIGLWIGAATIYVFTLNSGMDIDKARTLAFTGIIIFEKINVLNFRSFRYPLSKVKFWSNPYLLGAIAGTIGLQALAVYTPFLQAMLRTVPLAFGDWLMLFVIGLPVLAAGEVYKMIRIRQGRA